MKTSLRSRRVIGVTLSSIIGSFFLLSPPAYSYNTPYPRPPANRNVTISDGGLSITFNIAWGAVVVAIDNANVAHGLNIVDTHDVGRELQVAQFLSLRIHGRNRRIINPTQAGALGRQAYYQHPRGIIIREKGSPVVQWKATKSSFCAVVKPLDYDTGNPTRWVYVEHVRIDSRGVATFRYVFYDHDKKSYILSFASVPTLYSDHTGTFMYPLVSPYGRKGAALRLKRRPKWPVKVVTGAPLFPARPHHIRSPLKSKGWIANIDSRDNVGIFYTTPVGFLESYGTFAGAYVSEAPPLGKTVVFVRNILAHPGFSFAIRFSVLVSTPRRGPALISRQPKAMFKILRG